MSGTARGILYVVSTPIGNMEELSPRAQRILMEADEIAAEDTRTARKLVSGSGKKITSYFSPKEKEKAEYFIKRLKEGAVIALVSEAGTPCISDPGYILVRRCREEGIEVRAVAGPSAVTAALSISGMPADRFMFAGFLPKKTSARQKIFQTAASADMTCVIFESPSRIKSSLKDISKFIPSTKIFVCRELTKKFEQSFTGTPEEIIKSLPASGARGEFVIIIPPLGADKKADKEISENVLSEMLRTYKRHKSASRAAREVSEKRGLSYRACYKELLTHIKDNS